MASSVFFKFKSQKEPSRVSFDGTGISVFELKKEIINKSRLGDGTDFELAIFNEDTGEEYADDTTIIPRSTSIVARRHPAVRPGKGGAARYVSGKMPVGARGSTRPDIPAPNPSSNVVGASSELDNSRSEDEKIRALFNLQESQWREQQQEMSSAIPVQSGRGRGKPTNVPDHPPPPGYLCYRCREKGHWIQACPTNNDPKFDGRYRVKRSTGIPRSFQKQVDKPDTLALEGPSEHPKLSGVMVNADGDFVIAQPDKASWELYQEKANASAASAADSAAAAEKRDLERRGLLCPLDKRVLLAPTKTPCCQNTYCHDCISNALIESDFICPTCNAEGILLDDLAVDESTMVELKAYETEKTPQNKDGNQQSVQLSAENAAPVIVARDELVATREETDSKKRPAEELKQGDDDPETKKQRLEDGPVISKSTSANVNMFAPSQFNSVGNGPVSQYNAFSANGAQMNGLGLRGTNYFPPTSSWNQPTNSGFMEQRNASFSNNAGHPMPSQYTGAGNASIPDGFYVQSGPQSIPHQGGVSAFSNQQRTTFGTPFGKEEDNAYFRQPVNPHRHQARQRRIRPSDYREL